MQAGDVKNDIFRVCRFDYESDDVEILWLELKTWNFRCLYIAVCYLPPNSNSLLKQKFTDSLSTVLASLLVDPDCCVLIIGDFNDHSVFKQIQLQSNLFRTLSAFGFHQFIDTATRDRVILDWALTNVPSAVLSHGVRDHINNLDHKPIFIELNFSLKHHVVSKPFFVWDYNNGDFLGLNNALHVTPSEFIIMNSPSVNSALSNITNVINQTLQAYIPTKIVYPSNKTKPWFTRELRLLIRKRSGYYKRWLKTKNKPQTSI